MRAGLSTIQQTLTPEAASVLNHSIAEAGRRNHGQTTPLHVAATLLASPTGYLRQACIKSHPNSSHPLQCRALELCFSVALERLQTAQNMSPGTEPPVSNALLAALKRAQAHQRRGCPEQQQQPLLAVKVELEQLIISILDDPSVSRVMREASFSSPAVKATIEQSLNSSPSTTNSSHIGLAFRPSATIPPVPSRNLYLNPRLQQGNTAAPSVQQRDEEVKRVIDIMLRTTKKNPVLVGESEPEAVVKELLRRIENKELGEGQLGNNIQIIQLEKDLNSDRAVIPSKLRELGDLIETRIRNSNGARDIVLNLGDLKWLVEQPVSFGAAGQQQVVPEVGRAAVAEMGKRLVRFGGGNTCRLWLIGTATCETYLRCQVYHPSMENDWDLQAVPIAARAPVPSLFPRILSSSLDSLSPMKGFATANVVPFRPVPESLSFARKTSCCPRCIQNYEHELAKLVADKFEKSASSDVKPEAAKSSLPQWLQDAKSRDHNDVMSMDRTQAKDQELIRKQKAQELQKKWNDKCLHLHPKFHTQNNFISERIAPMNLSTTGLFNPKLLGHQAFQPKLNFNKSLGEALQLNTNLSSPVRTDLVLGQTKIDETKPEQVRKERVDDFLRSVSSEQEIKSPETQSSSKLFGTLDADSFKKLLKGLMENVWWQREAASAVATTVTQCKLGNGKRRGGGLKGDIWLLFMGPDRVGKKKMVSALAELISGSSPVEISFGSRWYDGVSNAGFRGKTVLDRISEAVRQNPFSVIVLEDIDEADLLIRGSIRRAIERGRLTDSHGREISLGNVMFILTTNWLPDNLRYLTKDVLLDEEKLASLARGSWQLRISLCEKTSKRRGGSELANDGSIKTKKVKNSTLAFDLNEAIDNKEDRADGSLNSSDLTIEREDEHVLSNRLSSTPLSSSTSRDLIDIIDDAILFKPVDFDPIARNIRNIITKKFATILDDEVLIEVEDGALEKIVAGVWLGKTGVEEWGEKALVPSFDKLKKCLPKTTSNFTDDSMIVRLELDGESGSRSEEVWLPSSVKVLADP